MFSLFVEIIVLNIKQPLIKNNDLYIHSLNVNPSTIRIQM